MTRTYEQLKEGPQVNIDRGALSPEERMDLRQIRVCSMTGLGQLDLPEGQKGSFTTIYYLEGDEKEAAAKFVEENQFILEQLDFSGKDVVQTDVSRPLYDLILDALGERVLTKFDSVVLETRANGIQWVIDHELFDNFPNRRYSLSEPGSARVMETSLKELYEEFETEITLSDLEAHEAVDSDARWILEYYRVANGFACDPVTVGDELAVRKRVESTSPP